MALGDDIRLLGSAPMLTLLEPDALRLLAFAADRRELRAGDVLFRKGERSDGGFVVAEGAIALETGEGEPAFTARRGALIGRAALFTTVLRPATAQATADSSVLHVSASLMRRMLEEFPAAAGHLRIAMAEDLGETMGALARVRTRLLALDGAR